MEIAEILKAAKIPFQNVNEAKDFLNFILQNEERQKKNLDRKKFTKIKNQIKEFDEYVNLGAIGNSAFRLKELKLRILNIKYIWKTFQNFEFTYFGEDDTLNIEMKEVTTTTLYFKALATANALIEG